jgi:hypothetical protein
VIRWLASLILLVAVACQPPPGAVADAGAGAECAPCAAADLCCAAHTANPRSNCELFATCLSLAAEDRAGAVDGCTYYVRVASTPPAPAACGPHPNAD